MKIKISSKKKKKKAKKGENKGCNALAVYPTTYFMHAIV